MQPNQRKTFDDLILEAYIESLNNECSMLDEELDFCPLDTPNRNKVIHDEIWRKLIAKHLALNFYN